MLPSPQLVGTAFALGFPTTESQLIKQIKRGDFLVAPPGLVSKHVQVSILWILVTINAQIEYIQCLGSVTILPCSLYGKRCHIEGFSYHVLTAVKVFCSTARVYLFLRLMTSSVYQNVQMVTMNLRFIAKARNVLGHVLQVISQLQRSVKSAGM